MNVLLTAEQIEKAIKQLVDKIYPDIPPTDNVAIVGIRSRGEVLARRFSQMLGAKLGRTFLEGTLDITLYRDDFNMPHSTTQPQVRETEIDFDVNGKFILLVDDVLHTGRSVRAALNALTDLGRPSMIRLAVLVDRGCNELPIRADYAGLATNIPSGQSVKVYLRECDGAEQVVVE